MSPSAEPPPATQSVFDPSHYASSLGQKLIRVAQLGPKYYLRDLPRYLASRARAGLSPFDVQAVYNPLFEFVNLASPPFARPPKYFDALNYFGEVGVLVNLPPARFESVAAAWWESRTVDGDVIECGSFQGATGLFLALLGRVHMTNQIVHLLDTFTGMPRVSPYDFGRITGEQHAGEGRIQVIQEQARALGVADRIRIHQGLFANTFASWSDDAGFSFVHIDANIYESTREACEFVRARMVPGGIIVFDDYNGSQDLGARLAIDLVFAPQPISRLSGGSAYLRVSSDGGVAEPD